MLYKSVTGAVLDVDDTSRRVKVVISEMGSKDFDDEIIDFKAFDKTIAERGPKGKNKIYHLTDHRPDLKHTLGKFSELYVEGNKLIGVNNILKTQWGNDVLEMYKAGTITEHSVGFQAVRYEAAKGDMPKTFTEVKLYEGSAVLLGANENTPTLSVGKSLTKEERELKVIECLDSLLYMIKNGTTTQEIYEYSEIHILQMKDLINFLFDTPNTTQAATTAPEPEKDNKKEDFKRELQLLTLKMLKNG